MTYNLATPLSKTQLENINVGDIITLDGWIYTGRDAVLPKLMALSPEELKSKGIDLDGAVIFHTAVSPAGVGPTSSNKKEIEESFVPLAKMGIRLFLGKGALSQATIDGIREYGAVYAVIPPTTALFEDQTFEREVAGWPELGMEALHRIKVKGYQAIVAAANGQSIYSKQS